MFSKIVATGSYLPSNLVTNEELSKKIDTSDEWIKTRTGISERHIAAENQKTSDLAVQAVQDALNSSGISIDTIDAIICATTTSDLTFPSCATVIQRKLGMKKGFAFDVQAVCSGFLYALSIADSLIQTNKAKRIIVIGAEVFSRILDWNDRNTCVLFGDGAGCAILEATGANPKEKNNSGILGINLFSDGTYTDDLKTTGGVSTTSSTGFVTMNGSEVYKHAVKNMSNSAVEILEQFNLEKSDLDFLIPHQANIRIINSVSEKLNLPKEKVIVTLNKHANTSAASVPLALDYAFKSGKLSSGDLVMMTVMGAGFTWGAGLIRV